MNDLDHINEEQTTSEDSLTNICRRLLQEQSFSTQESVLAELVNLGYDDVNQSTVCRILTKLNVVKVSNVYGKKSTTFQWREITLR